MNKKHIEMKDLLAWTYCQEMPKLDRFLADEREVWVAASSPWEAIDRLAVLGVRVDTSGPAPDDRAFDYPDEDAYLVNEAVRAIAGWEIGMPDGWDALGDCTGLDDAERADLHYRGWAIAAMKGDRLGALVMRIAVTGKVPVWRDHGTIYRRTRRAANGKPAWFRMVEEAAGPGRLPMTREVDGFNKSRQRPYADAYQKYYLDPCPSLLISERIEYQAWALALRSLADDLRGRLSRFIVGTCDVPLWPWEGEGRESAPRVLEMRVMTDAAVEPMQVA